MARGPMRFTKPTALMNSSRVRRTCLYPHRVARASRTISLIYYYKYLQLNVTQTMEEIIKLLHFSFPLLRLLNLRICSYSTGIFIHHKFLSALHSSFCLVYQGILPNHLKCYLHTDLFFLVKESTCVAHKFFGLFFNSVLQVM